MSAVRALVLVGRVPQVFLQTLDTEAKKRYWLSSTKPAMQEMTSALSARGFFILLACLIEEESRRGATEREIAEKEEMKASTTLEVTTHSQSIG